MLRLVIVVATAALGLLLVAPGNAKTTQLFAGVTYENDVQFTPLGPVAIRVVRASRPVGLYRLRTALSNERVLGRETVSSMQRRLAPLARCRRAPPHQPAQRLTRRERSRALHL